MMKLCVLLCAALAGVASSHHHHQNGTEPTSPSSSEPMVHSKSGDFRGSYMLTRRGKRFQAYRGIRYAQPPVGQLRFKAPRLIMNYTSEVDATQDGPACPQPVYDNYPVDEDCLRLNVYRPDGNV